MPRRIIIIITVIFLSTAVFSSREPSQSANANQPTTSKGAESSHLEKNKKAVENLKVFWYSLDYNKTLYNPEFSFSSKGHIIHEGFSLSFDVEIPDSGLILSMCREVAMEQITDSGGTKIEISPPARKSRFIYRPIQRFMKTEQSGGPGQRTLRVGLDAGLHKQVSGEIGIKGYLYGIVAESLKYVDIPFEPNDNWIPLTSDVEIRVREARNEASSYLFDIEQRPRSVPRQVGMRIGDFLPDGFVTGRQILKKSATGTSGGGVSDRIGGRGSGTGRAEKIRFTIAANPEHRKIPIEFERIPISILTESLPPRSTRSELLRDKVKPEQVKAKFDKKVAKLFEVNWNNITYRKTLYNPSVSGKSRDQCISERLNVYCEAEILDPRLFVGTCGIPVIEQITDGNGQQIDISRAQSRSNRMSYRTLLYATQISPPSKLIWWEGKARTALGLPLRTRHQGKRSLELQPVRLQIDLDPELTRQDSNEIGLIKGYFHALTAKSLKHVKIPFKSSDKWVRLTGDVEIQLYKVSHTGSAYRYEIKQRGQRPSQVHVGDRLPGAIVADRQFIGADSRLNSIRSQGGSQLLGNIKGRAYVPGSRADQIDFLIANGPAHNRIPFEIERIPLPKPLQ